MDRLINDCLTPSCEWESTDPEKLEEENRYIPKEHVEDMMKFDIVSSLFKEPIEHPKDFHVVKSADYTNEELNQFYRVYLENGYDIQAIEDAKLYCKYRDILTIEQMEELRGLLNRLPYDLHSLESRNYEIDYNGRFARQMLERQKCQIMGRENWKNPMDIPEIRAAVEWFDQTYEIKLDRSGIFRKNLL